LPFLGKFTILGALHLLFVTREVSIIVIVIRCPNVEVIDHVIGQVVGVVLPTNHELVPVVSGHS
jgi:hypothetical protein